jgi:hypothetical protein
MLLTIVALLLFTGCKNVEKLGPGNELALENQANLEKNIVRLFGNLEKLYAKYGDDKDKASLAQQKKVTIEQVAINYGWLLTIKDAAEANDLDPGFFLKVVTRAPAWIEDGKKIYDLIKELTKKDD